MDIYKTLQTLTETAGPSGMEASIAQAVRAAWEPHVDEITVDHMGNLLAVKRGQTPDATSEPSRLLIAAHMDEIALMVADIDAYPDDEQGQGFLRVTNVGGVDIRHLYGQTVTVHGRRELRGIVGALPPQMLPSDRQSKCYNYDELLVDVGLPLNELREAVSVGDFISFHQPLRKLLNERAAGKALDNRASVAAVAVALEYLGDRLHEWDVVAVATTQEETRLLGAFTTAYAQRPDAAIAVDVTFGKGPGARETGTFELDKGPALGLGPNVHPGLYKKLKEAADALEMTVHADPHSRSSGTDAFGLQIARDGVPTGLIGIPLRYMHTMVETLALNDVERAGRLLGEFAASLDAGFLDSVAAELM
ncbi:MAG: M42 family peptidase [Chloroflexota bacterium]